jgi:hypothetical protein
MKHSPSGAGTGVAAAQWLPILFLLHMAKASPPRPATSTPAMMARIPKRSGPVPGLSLTRAAWLTLLPSSMGLVQLESVVGAALGVQGVCDGEADWVVAVSDGEGLADSVSAAVGLALEARTVGAGAGAGGGVVGAGFRITGAGSAVVVSEGEGVGRAELVGRGSQFPFPGMHFSTTACADNSGKAHSNSASRTAVTGAKTAAAQTRARFVMGRTVMIAS